MGARQLDDDDDGLIEVRFSGIDCPESAWPGNWPAQPFSKESKELTRSLVHNKQITARLKGDVTYGRFVGEIYVDGRSLNRELVRAGLAWWNKSYEAYDLDYQRLEAVARSQRIGLWSDANSTPPWKWRRGIGH
jgi:micrococcal nuclease